MTIEWSSLANLSDADLLTRVRRAVEDERQATAQLIALIMELDARRLYLSEGCSSLFTYCTHVLHLTEHAAYGRIEAARAARKFPVILDRLKGGTLTLTAVCLLSSQLTDENHVAVLDEAKHKSKREVEQLVARLNAKPDVPATVRKLPAHQTATDLLSSSLSLTSEVSMASLSSPSRESTGTSMVVVTPRSGKHTELKPLAPERFKLQLTIGRETHDKLRRVLDLLRHTVPNGDLEMIFDRAISLLLEHTERTKLATSKHPRFGVGEPTVTRHIPAAVKRAVWRRDGGQCAFHGTQGRCRERGFLEFHHVVPFAAGGQTSVENLALRCRAHNVYEAEQFFGPGELPFSPCDASNA